MFIRAEEGDKLEGFEPDFTIINACSVANDDWKSMGLNSEVAVAFNIEKKLGVILGTWYGGENKKGIFSLMNYCECFAQIENEELLPFRRIRGKGNCAR